LDVAAMTALSKVFKQASALYKL